MHNLILVIRISSVLEVVLVLYRLFILIIIMQSCSPVLPHVNVWLPVKVFRGGACFPKRVNFATLTFRFLGSLDDNISFPDSGGDLWFRVRFRLLCCGGCPGTGITLRGRNCHVVYKWNAIELFTIHCR